MLKYVIAAAALTCSLAHAADYVYNVPPGIKIEHDVGPTFDDTVTFVGRYTGSYSILFYATDLRSSKVKTEFKDVWLESKAGTWHILDDKNPKFWLDQGKVYVLHMKGTSSAHGSWAVMLQAE